MGIKKTKVVYRKVPVNIEQNSFVLGYKNNKKILNNK